MNGSEPPSSITAVFSSRPASAATFEPARSEPVRVTPRTRRSAMIPSTAPGPTRRVWKTPSGKPASLNIRSIAIAHWGTLEACFSSATLPAVSAAGAKRKTWT